MLAAINKNLLKQQKMKFEIEQILTIKGKVYLLTKSLDVKVNFKLSDYSFFNNIEIENWFDIPRASDENGNQRADIFGFALKHIADKGKIKDGQILNLRNMDVKVVEVFYTISGKMGCILECGTGMLDVNKVLTDENVSWKIIENNMCIGRPNDTELQKQVRDNLWFQYFIIPIDHSSKPEIGRKLLIKNSVS
jgi:hypothetical protein